MRGESMKGKSKKSTYSTTFGVDPKNNGITEGFHRKMKLIQRRAYGYRNFENYRLRVLVECGVNL